MRSQRGSGVSARFRNSPRRSTTLRPAAGVGDACARARRRSRSPPLRGRRPPRRGARRSTGWAADRRRAPARSRALQRAITVLEGVPVDDHGRGDDDVGPLEVVGLEGLHVHVDEAQLVVGGHHAGDGQQPEGREGGLLADELEGLVEAPEGGGLLRVDQQGLRHVTAPFQNRRAAATEKRRFSLGCEWPDDTPSGSRLRAGLRCPASRAGPARRASGPSGPPWRLGVGHVGRAS